MGQGIKGFAGVALLAGVALCSACGSSDGRDSGGSDEDRDTTAEAPDGRGQPGDTTAEAPDGSGQPGDTTADAPDGSGQPGDTTADAPDGSGQPGDTTADVGGPYPEGLSDQTLDLDGTVRQYRVHVPIGLTSPRAVVFVLHGGGGEGLGVAELGEHPLSVFRTVADREGFVVVYPGGLPANDSTRRVGWVDCRADNTVSSGADDVGFLAALVTRVRDEYGLTSAEMFMTGGSNGAQMTHAFAFVHADLVGAVATGSGSLPETPLPGPCTAGPSRPLPILILHGTGDTQMPWDGGCVANVGGACNRGRVISAEATRERWLQINGLAGVMPAQSVIEVSTDDAGPANRWDYAGATPVQWWRLDGAGHTTPSQTVLTGSNPVTGTQSRDIEFAEVVWAFFESRLLD